MSSFDYRCIIWLQLDFQKPNHLIVLMKISILHGVFQSINFIWKKKIRFIKLCKYKYEQNNAGMGSIQNKKTNKPLTNKWI